MKLEEYKQATIDAMYEIIERYNEPVKYRNAFFIAKYCPLCKIHKYYNTNICRGCPLANIHGAPGCIHFQSFKKASEAKWTNQFKHYALKRAEFFEKIIPIIKPYSRGLFTYDGWSFFSALNRDW